jgi:hypothetical protein
MRRVKTAPPRPRFDVKGAELHVWEGQMVVRLKSGKLIRRRQNGEWREFGEGVEKVGLGYGRIFARFGKGTVREYDLVGEEWRGRGSLYGASRFHVGPRDVLACMGTSLFRLEGRKKWVLLRTSLLEAAPSMEAYASFVAVVGPPRPGRSVERRTSGGMEWVHLNGMEFNKTAATATSVYASDAAGILRITKRGAKRIGGVKGPLYPHRGGLFVVQRGVQVFEYRDDAPGWRSYTLPGDVISLTVDAVSGKLHALLPGGAIQTLLPGRAWGEVARIR